MELLTIITLTLNYIHKCFSLNVPNSNKRSVINSDRESKSLAKCLHVMRYCVVRDIASRRRKKENAVPVAYPQNIIVAVENACVERASLAENRRIPATYPHRNHREREMGLGCPRDIFLLRFHPSFFFFFSCSLLARLPDRKTRFLADSSHVASPNGLLWMHLRRTSMSGRDRKGRMETREDGDETSRAVCHRADVATSSDVERRAGRNILKLCPSLCNAESIKHAR